MKINWDDCRQQFVDVGGLCDVQVVDSTSTDWQPVLDFVRSSAGALRDTIDASAAELPLEASSIIALRATASPSLLFRWADIDVATHFFGHDDLEFDFRPGEICSQAQLDQLVCFISRIGRLLKKTILVYREGWEVNPFLTYDPADDNVDYSPQSI